jgi:hypothetical protein
MKLTSMCCVEPGRPQHLAAAVEILGGILVFGVRLEVCQPQDRQAYAYIAAACAALLQNFRALCTGERLVWLQ